MKYERPIIAIVWADFVLLSMSGPGATDIGAPTVESVWDEGETHYYNNIKEENYGEDWF